MSPEALSRLRGDIDAAREAGMDVADYELKRLILAHGREWNRETYINLRWGGELPTEWDESEIPEELQDWDAPPPT
jgi:hypothetical protein